MVYILEAFGGLMAGLIFTFLLLPWTTPFAVWKAMAILAAALALILHISTDRRRSYTVAYLLLLAIALSIPSGWLERSTAQVRWNGSYPGLTFVETRESPYSQLDLARQEGQYTLYANGQLAISFPDPFVYLEPVHGALVQHASPKTVLLVGGGPETIPLVLSHGVDRIDWVQLDPVEMALILAYLPEENRSVLDDPRVHLLYEDGRRIVQQARSVYDLILLSVPDPSSAQLNRYYTVEFYREAKRALKPDGVLAASIEASVAAAGEEVLAMAGSLPTPCARCFPNWRFNRTNVPVLCLLEAGPGDRGPETDERTLPRAGSPARRIFVRIRSALRARSGEAIAQCLGVIRAGGDQHRFPSRGLSPSADALEPVGGFRPLRLGIRPARAFPRVDAGAGLDSCCDSLGWISRRSERTRKRFNLAVAVAAIGLTGMAVELVLLLGFQNVFGCSIARWRSLSRCS